MHDKHQEPLPSTSTRSRQPIPCSVRRWPLFDVVPDGIEIRCRSCRHGVVHHISRLVLEQLWRDLAVGSASPESQV
ncbi:MAG: hypothetical protein ACRDHW_24245 [Ktedonobacteraceae bacterium]